MKVVKGFLLYIAPVLMGLFVGLSLFFPWQEVFELVFLKSSSVAMKNGIEIQADSFQKDGIIPAFTVKGMSVKYFVGGMNFREVHITPQLVPSLVKKSIVVRVELDSGKLELPAMVDRDLSGSFQVAWRPGILDLDSLSIRGDLSATGSVSLNLKTKKIAEADVKLVVPDDMDVPMNTLRRMLPLKRKPDGSWLLSRKGHIK